MHLIIVVPFRKQTNEFYCNGKHLVRYWFLMYRHCAQDSFLHELFNNLHNNSGADYFTSVFSDEETGFRWLSNTFTKWQNEVSKLIDAVMHQ